MKAKRVLMYSLASLMFGVVSYQQKLPNDTVLKSFSDKFTKTKYATWKHMDGSIWKAAFLWKEKECTALFEESGKWLETRTYLPMATLPKVVRESYRKADTGDALVKIFQVEAPEGIFFEFQLDEGNDAFKIRYDSKGKMIENSIL